VAQQSSVNDQFYSYAPNSLYEQPADQWRTPGCNSIATAGQGSGSNFQLNPRQYAGPPVFTSQAPYYDMSHHQPIAPRDLAQPYFDPSSQYRQPVGHVPVNPSLASVPMNAQYSQSASTQQGRRLYDPDRIVDSSEDWHSDYSPTDNQNSPPPHDGNSPYEYNDMGGSGPYGERRGGSG